MTAAGLPSAPLAAAIRDARRRQRRRRVALVLAVAAVVGVSATVWRGGEATVAPHGEQPLPATRFRLGAAPVAVTTARGRIWVVVETGGSRASLVELDPRTGAKLAAFAAGRSGPDLGAVTSSGGVVWAAVGNHVIRAEGARVERAGLPGEAAAVAVGYRSVWVATIGGRGYGLTRLDATTLALQARIPLVAQPLALRAGLGSVWLASTGGLWRIDPSTLRLGPAPAPLAAPPVGIAISGNRLWAIHQDRAIVAVDPTGKVSMRMRLPFPPGAIAVSATSLWVTDNCGCTRGKLALVDIRTRRLVAERPIGETPVALTADRTGAWVATFGDDGLSHVAAP